MNDTLDFGLLATFGILFLITIVATLFLRDTPTFLLIPIGVAIPYGLTCLIGWIYVILSLRTSSEHSSSCKTK